jgi:hypothetical protein
MPRLRRPASGQRKQTADQPSADATVGGVAFGGDNYGIISTGDHAVNALIHIQVTGGAAGFGPVTELVVRDIPVLRTFPENEPVGRAGIIEQVVGELADGMTVQLYGARGVGKKAIARAVIRRLSEGPEPVRGFELLPQGGQPHTLPSLYERLTESFFKVTTYEPPETRLRAAVAAASLTAVIVIGECELESQDLTRLRGTFPGCTFLLTSGHRTLFSTGRVHEVSPLPLEAAIELVAQETGCDQVGLERLRVDAAWELADGQAQRLVQYAAFIRSAQGGQDPLSVVPPREQAQILASGLSEPARSVLTALATFRSELTPDYFAAVTGLPAEPVTGPNLAEAGPELLNAGLVVRSSAVHLRTDDEASTEKVAYRVTPDAAAAVDSLGWTPASAETAARGVLPLLASRCPGVPPDPVLLLAIANALHDMGQDRQASHFIRAVMPEVLRAGQVQAWLRLTTLGLLAARAVGEDADLEYFIREDRTRKRLQGDEIVAAAALAGAELDQPRPPRSRRPLRRAARARAGAASAGHGVVKATAIIGAGVVVAAGATAVYLVPRHSGAGSVVTIGAFTGEKPSFINFGAATGSAVIDLTWTTWTDKEAIGRGKSYDNHNCKVNCYQARETLVSTTITLSDPVHGQFTVMTVASQIPSLSGTVHATENGPRDAPRFSFPFYGS